MKKIIICIIILVSVLSLLHPIKRDKDFTDNILSFIRLQLDEVNEACGGLRGKTSGPVEIAGNEANNDELSTKMAELEQMRIEINTYTRILVGEYSNKTFLLVQKAYQRALKNKAYTTLIAEIEQLEATIAEKKDSITARKEIESKRKEAQALFNTLLAGEFEAMADVTSFVTFTDFNEKVNRWQHLYSGMNTLIDEIDVLLKKGEE